MIEVLEKRDGCKLKWQNQKSPCVVTRLLQARTSDNEKSGDGIRINISNSGIKSKIVGLTIIIVGLILS